MTRQHAGTWARHRTPQEIIEQGKALMAGPFDDLSHKEFTSYVKETYGVPYQTALEWMKVAKRFDGTDLPGDLPEATLRVLGATSLTEEEVILILAAIKARRLPVQYRKVYKIVQYLRHPSMAVQEEVRDALRRGRPLPDGQHLKMLEESETMLLEAELRASMKEQG